MKDWDRKERTVHYTNRFRGRSFEGNLEITFENTKEGIRLAKRLDEMEAEMRELRTEEYIAKQAFNTVKNEERIRAAKGLYGIRGEVEALVQEVFDRTRESTKLTGHTYSHRHELPNAYGKIAAWIKRGRFSNARDGARYNTLYVEHELVCAAARIMSHDNTKKGADLNDRAWAMRHKMWEEWKAEDFPRVESWHCMSCDAECEFDELNWRGICPTCDSKDMVA